MKALALALVLAACGGAKPAAQPTPPQPAAAEPAPAQGSDEDPGPCEASGGKCVPLTAQVACTTQPAADCGENMFCCQMSSNENASGD